MTHQEEGNKTQAAAATMNRIHQALAKIPMDRLRLIMADSRVSEAEVRALLSQAGLLPEEIEANIENARRIVQEYARQIIPEGQGLESAAAAIQGKVEKMKSMLNEGKIGAEIKKVPDDQPLAAPTSPGMEQNTQKKELE